MATHDDQPADRQHWPIRVITLGEEGGDDLSAVTTPADRLALVWELTERSWRLANRAMPQYTRAAMPIRVTRRA